MTYVMRPRLLLALVVLFYGVMVVFDPSAGILLLLLLPVVVPPVWLATAAGMEHQAARRERIASLELEARFLAELRAEARRLRDRIAHYGCTTCGPDARPGCPECG